MTTTTEPPIVVRKLSARRAEIDGEGVTVPAASKLDQKLMEIIKHKVRVDQRPRLVHVTGQGDDYWRVARLSGAFDPVPDDVVAQLAGDDENLDDDEDPAAVRAAFDRGPQGVTAPPVIGQQILPAETVEEDDDSADGPVRAVPQRVAEMGVATRTVDRYRGDDPGVGGGNSPSLPAVAALPTVEAFLAAADKPRPQRAQEGWRAWFHLPPGPAELARRADEEAIRRPFLGTRNIVVVNPKGGVTKTTTVVGLAMTIGRLKQGTVLAWDNNETVGNLGSRTVRPTFSVVDLLGERARFAGGAGTIGDLSNFVRDQPDGFDVLASADTTAKMEVVDADAFQWVDELTDRWYRVKLIDTGNNQLAANYKAALASADQLVIATELAEDSAEGAVRLVADLRAGGYGPLVDRAVTVLSGTASGQHKPLERRMRIFFEEHTRAVLGVPFDPALVGGRLVQRHQLRKATVRAWERVAAAVVSGL